MEIILGLIAVYIAWITYTKTFTDKNKEQKEFLYQRTVFVRDLNLKLLQTLSNYTQTKLCGEDTFVSNQTFNEALSVMKSFENMFTTPVMLKAFEKKFKNLQVSEINANQIIKDMDVARASLYDIQDRMKDLKIISDLYRT